MTDLQQPEAPAAPSPDLTDLSLYFNRELSWLDFNDRVLQLAEDDSVPLLERLKFCAIYSSNLDEFFMVRVAGLQEYVDAGIDKPREDGRSPAETIAAIGAAVREQTHRQTKRARPRPAPAAGRARHPDPDVATRSTRATATSWSTASGARSSPC